MLVTTEGIIIKVLKYSDSSVICKIFTKELGERTYIVNGVRTSKSKGKAATFQPMNYLDLVVYEKQNQSLARLKEFQIHQVYIKIISSFQKSAVVSFVCEVLNYIVNEQENHKLFDRLIAFLNQLETEEQSIANYPLAFLLMICESQGIDIFNNYSSSNPFFSFEEGSFVAHYNRPSKLLNRIESEQLSQVLSLDHQAIYQLQLNKSTRKVLVNALEEFLIHHIDSFQPLKTKKVYQNIFE